MSASYNSPVKDIVFGSFNMPEQIWPEERLKITWVSLASHHEEEMANIVIKAIKAQNIPKNILVQCFQRHVGEVDVEKLIRLMGLITEEAKKQTQNRVAFGTSWFTPAKANVWACFSIFNKETHRLNEELGVARVNLHKCLMSQVDEYRDLSLMIRGQMYLEFQLGVDLGSTVSIEGIKRLKNTLMKVFDHAFQDDPNRPRSNNYRTKLPPSLSVTPGYEDDQFMIQLLEEKRIIKARTRSAGNNPPQLRCSDKRSPGWRKLDVFIENGALWNYESRGVVLQTIKDARNISNEVPKWIIVDEDDSQDMDITAEDKDGDNNDDDETDYDDEVFCITAKESEKSKKSKTKKQSCKDCNEIENLLQLARDNVKDSERQLTVAVEKMKVYKQEIESKEAQLAKERAATKHWREVSEKKRLEYEQLLDELSNLKIHYNKSKVKKIK